VLIPRTKKDFWNTRRPRRQAVREVLHRARPREGLNARVLRPDPAGRRVCRNLATARARPETDARDISASCSAASTSGPRGRPDVSARAVRQEAVDELRLNTKTQSTAPCRQRRPPWSALQLPDADHRPARPGRLHALDIRRARRSSTATETAAASATT
jgi:hypothetical protein